VKALLKVWVFSNEDNGEWLYKAVRLPAVFIGMVIKEGLLFESEVVKVTCMADDVWFPHPPLVELEEVDCANFCEVTAAMAAAGWRVE